MQLAQRGSRPAPTRQTGPGSAAGLAMAGMAWLVIACVSAWLVFATPLLARLIVLDSPGAAAPFIAMVALAVAMTAPAVFAFLGVARLVAAAQRRRDARDSVPPVTRLAEILPPACSVIPRIQLPDGCRIPDVVIGPHGVAFFEPLPPPAAVRRSAEHWEVRFSDRRWRPIENPLQRAARDSERLRRHLDAQERDFVVRVAAAVLRGEHAVTRIEGCAVVALEDVPAWLAALPAQRGLTPDRLAHLREVLQALEVPARR